MDASLSLYVSCQKTALVSSLSEAPANGQKSRKWMVQLVERGSSLNIGILVLNGEDDELSVVARVCATVPSSCLGIRGYGKSNF